MSAVTVVLTMLCAALLGAAANWAADVLPGWRDRQGQFRLNLRRLPHYATVWWYPWTRGVCPHCGEKRSKRHPALELGIIVLIVLFTFLLRGEALLMLVAWIYVTFLLTVLVIDYEHRRVLNIMLGPAAIVVLLLSLLPVTPDPLNALLGGAVGLGLFLLMALISRGSLGAGDVKLAAVIGLMIGYPGVLPALLFGILLGGVAAVTLLVSKRAGRKSTMAYAPYMAMGTLVVMLRFAGAL